jgi:hypothetical protein
MRCAGSACAHAPTRCGALVGSARRPTRRRRRARPIWCAPLFGPWPLMLNPVLDRFLVAFGGLPLGPLDGPAQPPDQQPPHRRVRQRHPGQPWTRIAMRSSVHTSLANPCASAPCSSACSIPSSCSSATLGRRPVGPRVRTRGFATRPSHRPASAHASGRRSGARRPAGGRPGPGCGPGRTARRRVPGGPGAPPAAGRRAFGLAACGGWSTCQGMLPHHHPTVTST